MNNHWQKLRQLFLEALELEGADRDTFVKKACGDDEELLNDLRSLLEAHQKSGPVDQPPEKLLASIISPFEESGERDQQIGPYRLVKLLGQGGMGVVYLAERADGEFEQQVALKLLPFGLSHEKMVRRFRAERQILASLQHPHIARLLDGGVTEPAPGQPEGTPWFAMEYVRGIPVTDYCDENHLSVDQRLTLFLKVCRAVQHAHQRLIIHRDLKPSNILVTEKGEPHLLDFGLARLMRDEASGENFTTRSSQNWMTLKYASPEQVKGESLTTASDTYQLGLILYELLTGQRPYNVKGRTPSEAERIICETEPTRPSTAVLQGKPEEAVHDLPPHLTPEKMQKRLQGDLDTIMLKALHKSPEHRYTSVEMLIGDLERHRQGIPIQARPATAMVRIRKFVHRHRTGVVITALFMLTLAAFIIMLLRQQAITSEERDHAVTEAQKAAQVTDFLVELFEAADPAENQGEQITAREIVEKGIDRLEEDLGTEPEVHIEMLTVLGRVQQALGDFDLSTELLEEALARTRELRGGEHLEVASVAALLGDAARWNGELDKAETLLREALEIRRRQIDEDNAEVAINMDRLARVLEMQGDFQESETLYREALAMRERLFGEDSDAVAANLSNLGWLLHEMGREDEAEEALRRSLQIREQILESPHPYLASTTNNLAVVLSEKGNYEEAEYYAVQALEQERKLHGDDHPRVTTAISNRAGILIGLAQYREAAEQYQQVLENDRRQLGPEHLYVGITLGHLSTALIEDGRGEDAMPYLEEALEIFHNTVGEEHRYFAMGLMIQGEALTYQDSDEAAIVLEQSVQLFQKTVGPDHPDLAEALTHLGRARFIAGEIETAETVLRGALEIQRQTLEGTHSEKTIWTLINLGRILTEMARTDEAEPLLREAVEASADVLPPEHWRGITARLEFGACLLKGGHRERAREEIELVLAELEGRTDFHAVRLQNRANELVSLN